MLHIPISATWEVMNTEKNVTAVLKLVRVGCPPFPTATDEAETVTKCDLGDKKGGFVERATRRSVPYASGNDSVIQSSLRSFLQRI